jgi:phosphoglucosamine mutase
MSENIFRAYDIRGVYRKELTLDFAEKVGRSFGTFLGGNGTVVMSRDARHGGPEIQAAVSRGLNKAGLDTIDIGMLPTPAANYHTARIGATAGVIISASHNPPEYNGIRFRKGDGAGYPECIEDVKEMYLNSSWREAKKPGNHGSTSNKKVVEEYLNHIVAKTKMGRLMKVIVDPGNGAASGVGARLFKKLGCSVTAINDFPDGGFPGRSAYPNEKTLGGLQTEVKKQRADFGVAYDGDADRAVFVDDEGSVKSAEAIGAVLAKEILNRKKGVVALNVDCSMSVEEAVKSNGGTVKRIRVGDVFLADAVKEGAVFAMESSSHFVVPNYFGFDDGIAVSAYLAQILSGTKEKLSELTARIPKYPVVRKTMAVPDDKKFKAVERLAEMFKERRPLTIDGVKVNYPNGWTLVRVSNTQPLLRLTAEGRTQAEAKRMMAELESAVKKCL